MTERRVLAVAVVALLVGSAIGGAAVATLGNGDGTTTGGPDATGPVTTDGDGTATASDAGVAQFDSTEAFRRYVRRGSTDRYRVHTGAVTAGAGGNGNGNGGGGATGGDGATRRAPEEVGVERADPADADGRHSSTNVQEAGIDEPDVLKTTGAYLYYARGPAAAVPRGGDVRARTDDRDGDAVRPRVPRGETYVFDTRSPASPERIATINGSGRLLRSGDYLVAIRTGRLVGYDVSQPGDPTQAWSRAINGSVETARLHDGTVYVVTRTAAGPGTPCPIRPLGGDGAAIPCSEVYHPRGQVGVDATYSAYAVAPADGAVRDSVSFVGTARDSTVYMSENALYVTYTERTGRTETLIGALASPAVDAPESVVDRLRAVRSYNLSARATEVEVRAVVDRWLGGLPAEQREQTRRDLRRGIEQYVRENRRNLTTTGIVRVAVDDGLSVAATGSVPGEPLDQFSMDAEAGHLRITTTIPRQQGLESENDLYVLNATTLDRVGAETGMGLDQRVYAVRYVGDTAYVVTFRRVDPFHVVDLSDPGEPEEVGELELPGFSSYLHPVDDTHVLGIGREDGQVKTVLFDVSDPSNPTIEDTYFPDAGWSAVSESHHAFLLDRRHGVFFLPGSDGGYVVDYTGGDLSEVAHVETAGAATRAAYVDDYMYVFSDRELVVVDERNWSVVDTTDLAPTFEGPAGVYQSFVDNLSAGDLEGASDLVHAESPLAERPWLTGEDEEFLDEFDATVTAASVRSRDDSSIRLVATTVATLQGRTTSTRTTVTLRRQDDRWLLWEIES